MDMNTLRAFVRTIERGSVTGAARDLALSQPAVSKHLRQLEARTGVRLFERTARSVRPTAQGLALYEASRAALATLEAALEGVQRDAGAVEGSLRLFAPSCLGSRQFYDAVAAFQLAHPAVRVDLVLDMRPVDLVYENFDLALTYTRPDTQDTIVSRIGAVRRVLAAAPAYLDRAGAIRDPDDLAGQRLAVTPTVLSRRGVLALRRGELTVETGVTPALTTNSADVLLRALRSGGYVGPVQSLLIGDDLAAGTLVRILRDYEVQSNDVYVSYPSARLMRPVVRAFVDLLIPRLKAVEGIA